MRCWSTSSTPVSLSQADGKIAQISDVRTGVCHTDLHAVNGDWPLPTKLPLVGGHEGAGVVVAKGDLVKDIELGDHVGVKWINGSCLACDFCQQADEPVSCSQRGIHDRLS